MLPVIIEELWIYPVKSLAGISVNSATLTHAGLAGDREWMIVDAQGMFMSQRKLPRMATIKTELRDGQLVLSRRGDGEIQVREPAGDTETVKVWNSVCKGFVADADVNAWLQQALALVGSIKLVYFDKREPRPTDAERFGPYHTHFADGSPYLLASEASLQALNAHLQRSNIAEVDILRFRPNIVFSGLPAFAEHGYSELQIPAIGAQIGLKDYCQRCSVITVDQATGIPSPHQHPFQSLAEINGMPTKPKAPAFGVNSVLVAGAEARLSCGDKGFVFNSSCTQ